MAKQWVDITTLNNTTPFGKVRWLQNLTIAYNTSNMLEFSELSGITIDGRSWSSNSGPSWGYASTHRVANNDNSFTCTFLNEYRTSNDVTVQASNSTAGTAVHDVARSVYYDDVVTIDGKTFYEVDFTTWSGYTPLYYCYTGTSVSAGQVYVEIDSDPIVVDKNKLSFKSSGETKNVVVVSDSAWTATTSEAWVTLSTSSGASGETTLSVTAPEYTSTIEDRTATITLTDGEFSVTINVTQKKYSEGVSEMYLGTLNMEAAYFGNLEVEAIYLGEYEVYSSGPKIPYADCQITTTAASETVKLGYNLSALTDLADLLVDGVSVKSSLVDNTYTFADAGVHIVRYVYTSSTAADVTYRVNRLESFSASTEVKKIGDNALNMYQSDNQSVLTSIYLPNVTEIGYQGITNVPATDIYAPNIKILGNKALQFNQNLDPVSMPLSGVTSIGNNAIRQSAIKEAHFGPALTTYDYNVFNECYSLSALTFDGVTGLTYMPSLGDKTYDLTEIIFPDSITTYAQDSMSYGMITNSKKLQSVTFGSGATTIQGLLFKGDVSALTEIKCYATTAPSIVTGCFGPVTANTGTLYVPAGSDYSTWAAELGSNWTVSDTL